MSPRHYDVENFWNFRLEDLQFLLKQCLERGQHLKDPWPSTATFDTCDTRRDSRWLMLWFGAKDADHQLPAQSYRRGHKTKPLHNCFRSMPGFMADTDPIACFIASCAAGVSFTQAELDQIFELLEEFEEMPILFSDETLAYIMLGISWYIYTFYTYGMWMFGECPAFWRCVFGTTAQHTCRVGRHLAGFLL